MSLKFVYHVCEQNSNAKCPATPFSSAQGVGGRVLWNTSAHKARENKFYVNDRFFTTSCDPIMSHTLRLLKTFCLKRTQSKGLKKMTEVRIKQDKCYFFKLKLLH
jgi:hypothetical protein